MGDDFEGIRREEAVTWLHRSIATNNNHQETARKIITVKSF
jgi:hypothetical protein